MMWLTHYFLHLKREALLATLIYQKSFEDSINTLRRQTSLNCAQRDTPTRPRHLKIRSQTTSKTIFWEIVTCRWLFHPKSVYFDFMQKKIRVAIMADDFDRRPERTLLTRRLIEKLAEDGSIELTLVHSKR